MAVTKSFSRKVSTKRQAVAYLFYFVTGFYSLDNICMVDKKILWQDLLFFRNLYDAPDASIALVDYERHTFYHHHRSVETQCLWLVDTYLADKSV